MIWIIGGTKESRDFIEQFPLKSLLIVTTATDYGAKLLEDIQEIKVIAKRMNKEEIRTFIDREKIRIVVDLSHPYAKEISENAIDISKEKKLFYIRFERKNLDNLSDKNSKEFTDIDDLIRYIETLDKNILVTLGSNLVEKFKGLKNLKNIYFRVLPKWEILKKVEECGVLPKNIIAMQGPFTKEMNTAMIKQLNIRALVTKDSGTTGGEKEKKEGAQECEVELITLIRPKIDYPFQVSNLEELNSLVFEYIK